MTNEQEPVSLKSDLANLARAAAVLVPVVAAIEVFFVRYDHPNQPVAAVTFFHTILLWSVFALAALLAALVVGRLRARLGLSLAPTGAWGRLLFWMATPIAVHAALDRYTTLGQNVAALLTPRPWLEVAGVLVVLALLGFGFTKLMAVLSIKRFSQAALGAALVVGLFLPLGEGEVEAPESISAEQAARPNILLLVWDTTRPDHLTPYGYSRETTPELNKFAEQSLVFRESRSVSIFTFTSHLSMLTGKYPAATGARLYRMQLDPSLSESVAMHLAESGYRTGGFVGTWVLAGTTGIQRGFEVYDDRVDPAVCFTHAWQLVHDVQAVLADKLEWMPSNGMPHWFQDFQRPADEVLALASKWIERDDPRPWFCMINLYDVHWPYLPTQESKELLVRPYDGPMDGYLFRSDSYQEGYVPTPEDGRHVADLYDAELLELDRKVGRFLADLNLDESNTAVIMTADHGEAFGEAGRFKHEDIVEPQVRVPLCIRLPGANPPSGVQSWPTTGVDIAPTILGLAGLPVPPGGHGRDLLGEAAPPERPILVEDRDHASLSDVRYAYYEGTWKFVRMGQDEAVREYLFDLSKDPVGEHDLSAEFPERKAEMAVRMDAMRAPWVSVDQEVELTGLGASADALGGLGYLGGEEEEE